VALRQRRILRSRNWRQRITFFKSIKPEICKCGRNFPSASLPSGIHSFESVQSAVGFDMLTSQKVIDAINEQIGYEFSAELQYYAIAAHFAAEALPQLSQHFFQQAEEEKGHALRFIKYVVDAGGRVVIPAIDAPKSKFKTPKDAVKLSLDQEIHVTQQINALVNLATKQSDYITINFLQWFLTEQLEEVSSMDNLLKIVERAGNDLLQADEYLARVGIKTMPEPPKE
jgi:ferritin